MADGELNWQSISNSSNVARAAMGEGGVVVEFKDGSRYLYEGADDAALAGLVMSPSPGSYVRRVLGGHPYSKIG